MHFERRNKNRNLDNYPRQLKETVEKSLYYSLSFHTMHTQILATVLKRMGNIHGKKVVFVGGGEGNEILYIKNNSKDFYAVNLDINLKRLRICKYYFRDINIQCTPVLGDGMSLPFKNSIFDIVFLINSAHHMDSMELCLRESLRIGKIVCIVDRRKCFISKIGRRLGLIKPDYDGYYTNEIDVKWFFKFIKDSSNVKLVYLKYHFFLLLYVNKTIHDLINRYRPLCYVYILLVKILNLFFGFLGNGIIVVLSKSV
ncbi:MAG: hypothetical protein COS99_01075 [Candidatus Omnitrophica bacterium CG07_land_8_20_14_0_80_42_15]|uniref:Methyltransferase type 11 domain-containing protein n=1 Tax=Candidatus Aquitaenariimonas noxiae TaxID=1974741 RepID=A0A2J0L4J0_9BACT|nr:MAG: hypothetical protein COS99_01075 [Candidatus Omnitrophica bacterium CG07_land_8_20_14_0_80_42_15]